MGHFVLKHSRPHRVGLSLNEQHIIWDTIKYDVLRRHSKFCCCYLIFLSSACADCCDQNKIMRSRRRPSAVVLLYFISRRMCEGVELVLPIQEWADENSVYNTQVKLNSWAVIASYCCVAFSKHVRTPQGRTDGLEGFTPSPNETKCTNDPCCISSSSKYAARPKSRPQGFVITFFSKYWQIFIVFVRPSNVMHNFTRHADDK